MKKFFFMIFALVIVLSLWGCSQPTPGFDEADERSVTFEDALGYSVHVNSPQKVAVVMGSFAETWLLSGGKLTALTEDAFSEQRIEPDASLINLGAMKAPNIELMIKSGVDFVILSANISEHVALRDQLENAGITTAYFDMETFADYLDMLKICTDINNRPDLYEKNGLLIREQINAAIAQKEGHTPPSVLFIRAFSTGARSKGSDNMTGAMLKDLGCINIADRQESLLENLSLEQIILDDPDFIFVTTMGASSEAALQSLAEGLQANPAWNELTAVKEGRYYVLPRDLFHYKPNNRWGESYQMLAEILYGR